MSDDTPEERQLPESYAQFETYQAMFRHVEKRLNSIGLTIAAMETERAVSEEKRKFMEARFNHIDRRLEKIEGHISRLVWLIIATIIGASMSFVMSGGMVAG
ncbi:MAG: hypothetical protein AB8B82_01675 [Roseovarius sp.]